MLLLTQTPYVTKRAYLLFIFVCSLAFQRRSYGVNR